MRKLFLVFVSLLVFGLVAHFFFLRPVMTNPAPARTHTEKSASPDVASLSMVELENFRLRLKNDKFYIYDGKSSYFEILRFSGTYDDLMNAMDDQPFKSKVYLDTIGRIVVLDGRQAILIVETYPAFDYEQWKRENENQ